MSENKHRIYELAKEYGVTSKEVMSILSSNDIEFKNHTSTVNEAAKEIVENVYRPAKKTAPQAKPAPKAVEPKVEQKEIPQNQPVSEKLATSATPNTAPSQPVAATPSEKVAAPQKTDVSADPAAPAIKYPFTPSGGPRPPRPAGQPQGSRPFVPAGQRPPQPGGSRPFVPAGQPQGNRPFVPAGQRPPQPGGSRPFVPAGGQRPGGAPAGGQRPPSGGSNFNSPRPAAGRPAGGAPSAPAPGAAPANRFSHQKRKGPNRNEKSWKDQDMKVAHKTKHPFQKPVEKVEKIRPEKIEVGETISVTDFANKCGLETNEVIKKLLLLGVMATINQEIDYDTATLVASDFGIEVVELPPELDPTEIAEIEDDESTLVNRPPVVTIMGHVDHGKTSLLDVIRQTNVTAREAGGITQHIGAYQISTKGKKITFLDTPGHEAFTAMRARGAQATDIAILVVAANDGVMPQTLEALNHAKSAGVPIIVAINKMDIPDANPDRVKQQLSEQGLLAEDWGGDTIMVPVSARQKTGIDDLLENILLVAEIQDLKANPHRAAQGIVIEAQLDKGRGPVATILVQKGTLHVGDSIIAGLATGKVRALINDKGENVKKAEPSVPVEVLGLSEVPQAGDSVIMADEKIIKAVVNKRVAKKRNDVNQHNQKVSLEDIFQQIQDGNIKELNIVVKADVQGSIEALRQSLENLKNKEVRVNIIHSGVGAINETDVMLATASNAIIIGFNVRPDANARKSAEAEKVDIRSYRVIYEAINDVEKALEGMLAPEFKEVVLGHAEVRQIISIPKGGVVGGSYIQDGKMTSKAQVRVIRGGIVIHDGIIESLRRFKDDVKEVASGYECGITVERYRDLKEGDVLEAYIMEEIKRG